MLSWMDEASDDMHCSNFCRAADAAAGVMCISILSGHDDDDEDEEDIGDGGDEERKVGSRNTPPHNNEEPSVDFDFIIDISNPET